MTRTVPTSIVPIVGLEENKPVELYELNLLTETLLFAATIRDVTVGTSVYTAIGIQRSPIRTTMELEVDEVTLTVDNIDLAFSQRVIAEQFIGRTLKVKKAFLDELASANIMTLFQGRMDEPIIKEKTFQVKVRSELDALHHSVPRRLFSTLCNYTHYDVFCTASKLLGSNLVTGSTLVQSGFNTTTKTIISSAFFTTTSVLGDEHWAPIGTIIFKTGSNANLGREVQTHFANSLSVGVRIPFPFDFVAGDIFEIFRGCRKTVGDCQDKYDNYLNYGGFPVTPRTPIV